MKKHIEKDDASLSAPPLSDKTTYSLLTDTAKLIDDLITKNSSARKLQTGARRVLACLALRDGVSQLDLIRATHLKAPTISLIVQKMEHDGIIMRKSDDVDMRMTRVFLTEAGVRLNKTIAAAVADAEALMTADYSEEEKTLLHNLLSRAYANLEAARSSDQ